MNILSLFDGISGAMLALKQSNIKVKKYFASEIDKHCINVSKEKFPEIIQLGDVKKINLKELPRIDLLIGGSPCQDLSNAYKGQGLEGIRSSLFFEFIKIKKIVNPKYFVLENVKNKWKKIMDDYVGEAGVTINSESFTSQFRPRCYWSNIPIDPITTNSNLIILDILEKKPVDQKYYFSDQFLNGSNIMKFKNTKKLGINKIYDIPRNLLKDNERQRRVYSVYGKSPTLLARSDTPKIYFEKKLRKLTPLECERLQGIIDNHTLSLSNTQRYKAIGNSFTIPVISHILKNIGKKKKKQMRLFNEIY